MKAGIMTLGLLIFYIHATCQWYDNNWILGYDFEGNQSLSETILVNFNSYPPSIAAYPLKLDFIATNITVSDEAGNFLFYSNGIQIHDKDDNLMPGGDSINAGEVAFAHWFFGYTLSQGIMALPAPGNPLQYYLIHRKKEFNDSTGINVPDLLYTVVDMSLNNGKGAVVTKNNMVKKTFWFDSSAATLHANGRDWWVLTPDYIQNKIYRFRLSPEGITDTATQTIGYKPLSPDSTDGGGQNFFSPDGSVFVDYDGRNGIRIYDFDRCTGWLSNFRWIQLPLSLVSPGAAISPNSRYLYVNQRHLIFQFDLWADDIAATLDTVAINDGFLTQGIKVNFGAMILGPDGKLYIDGAPTRYMHVINKPNEMGQACDVRQHSILLPEYLGASLPYYPNYRLGPLDGSPCDTLGLDNHPLARFTWEAIDTLNPLLVEFTNNSFYEPTQWFWDFGGTGTSTEVNPLHTFPADGTYTVCLTVSNQYDSDTFCREVTVGVTGTKETEDTFSFTLYPNPGNGNVHLKYALPTGKVATWKLFDALGREWRSENLSSGFTRHTVLLDSLPAGLYFYRLTIENELVKSGSLVIQAP